MDEGCNKAVTEVFVKMHEKGYIYKGVPVSLTGVPYVIPPSPMQR